MTSPQFFTNDPFTVIGIAVRTDSADSAHAIPALWGTVLSDNALDSIPGRSDARTFAVYTNLENAGQGREGWFTFLIGAKVEPGTPVPDGMTLVSVPASARARFPVPGGDPARVLEAWTAAWSYEDSQKSFLCEYEQYDAEGASVNLGLRATPTGH